VGEAKATRALPVPLWVKTVVNRLSPVTSRRPAPSSLPMKPPSAPPLPSPNTVVMPTLPSFQTSAPASATALSPGSSSISRNWSSWPFTSKSMSSATPALRLCCHGFGSDMLCSFGRLRLAGCRHPASAGRRTGQ
jgi:hypothetical protein